MPAFFLGFIGPALKNPKQLHVTDSYICLSLLFRGSGFVGDSLPCGGQEPNAALLHYLSKLVILIEQIPTGLRSIGNHHFHYFVSDAFS